MMNTSGIRMFCVLMCVLCIGGIAQAEEATTSSEGGETASPAATSEGQGNQGQAAPGAAGTTPQVDEIAVRFGRVEMVLIENQDPESAMEFGAELIAEDGDSPHLRLLLAACLMTLNRPADALEHLNEAASMSENNPGIHLRVLFNIARAHQGAGQLVPAADAYDQYVSFARAHQDLPSFANEAQITARVLRNRAESSR